MSTVTIKDIAKLAGVSYSTVSRALNGSLHVSEETRERIWAICREQGYHVNRLARSLSAGHSEIIGCIVSDLDNPLFAEAVLNLEQYARRRGYCTMICHGRVEDTDIRALFDFLIGHRVAGIILFSSSRQAPELVRMYMDRVPIVLQGTFEAETGWLPVSAVSTDNYTGGKLAAEYLCDLGHRKAVYLGVRWGNVSHSLRCKGFLDAARQRGMDVRVLPNETVSSTMEIGYALAKQLFLCDFQDAAVFASCDSLALGVMSAAREFCLSIPEDFSLIGFDNIACSAYSGIRLTTIGQNKKELMERTVDCLLEKIENPGHSDPVHCLVPPLLLERGTCRRL